MIDILGGVEHCKLWILNYECQPEAGRPSTVIPAEAGIPSKFK